ncbi:acyl transferase/acyl hydrolase/lysophospholipase [Camillea tinctor]|nr:acyl transferase/acyl hydrolase/lysophospholipase [Camillea tinctor]
MFTTSRSVDAQALSDCTIWQAARATSAAATFFDPIQIGLQTFVDGATGNNNPVTHVLDEAKLIWPDAVSHGRVQCIVSVGTGLLDDKNFGDDLRELIQTLKHISTETEMTESRFFRDHERLGIGGRYFRFNVNQGLADVQLGASESLGIIEAATEKYLRDDRVGRSINKFVSSKAVMYRTFQA